MATDSAFWKWMQRLTWVFALVLFVIALIERQWVMDNLQTTYSFLKPAFLVALIGVPLPLVLLSIRWTIRWWPKKAPTPQPPPVPPPAQAPSPVASLANLSFEFSAIELRPIDDKIELILFAFYLNNGLSVASGEAEINFLNHSSEACFSKPFKLSCGSESFPAIAQASDHKVYWKKTISKQEAKQILQFIKHEYGTANTEVRIYCSGLKQWWPDNSASQHPDRGQILQIKVVDHYLQLERATWIAKGMREIVSEAERAFVKKDPRITIGPAGLLGLVMKLGNYVANEHDLDALKIEKPPS